MASTHKISQMLMVFNKAEFLVPFSSVFTSMICCLLYDRQVLAVFWVDLLVCGRPSVCR